MDVASQFDMIVELFDRLGVEVRQERLGGSGGNLCHVRGEAVMFVDLEADVATRADRCLEALASLPQIDTVFVPPELRERIESYR